MNTSDEPDAVSPAGAAQPEPQAELVDGHSIQELGEYLDRGRTPPDATIDNSSECQMALADLMRLRELSEAVLDIDAAAEPPADDNWINTILAVIAQEARSGRDIPYELVAGEGRLEITEGAVRGIIRAAGDNLGGILIGRCLLNGDITVPGEPITIDIEATGFWGRSIPEAVADVRTAIYTDLRTHTPLNIVAVNVTVHDLQIPRRASKEAP